MDKLIKIWKLKDNITNMQMVFSCRDDACDFEHSDTIIEEGYFITKEQLIEIGKYLLSAAFEERFNLDEDDSELLKYLKDLGVE